MSRAEFILATTTLLLVAFLFGWLAACIYHRLTRVTGADIGTLDEMAQSLHQAEEARDEAVAYQQTREADLTARLSQSEAERAAALEGLREARSEADQLRAYIERRSQR